MTVRALLRVVTVLVFAGALAASQTPAAVALTAPRTAPQADEDGGWPRQIEHDRATIIMYQPEIEQFQGNTLSGRAAVSVTANEEGAAPVFGAVWVDSRVEADRETRMVEVVDVTVTNVAPDVEDRIVLDEDDLVRLGRARGGVHEGARLDRRDLRVRRVGEHRGHGQAGQQREVSRHGVPSLTGVRAAAHG